MNPSNFYIPSVVAVALWGAAMIYVTRWTVKAYTSTA